MRDLFIDCVKVFNTKMIFHSDNFKLKNFYEKDNFLKKKKNYEFIKTNSGNSNSTKTLSESFSKQVKKISNYLEQEKPSVIILIGDRSETFASAVAATYNQIPILHIHGGEVSFGSIDEKLRHCISKLSSFHLVSHNSYRKRLIQLGEKKRNIKVIGSLSLDSISRRKILSKKLFFKKYNYLSKKFILVSLNSSLYKDDINNLSKYLFKALDRFKNIVKVVSYPNSDLHNSNIIKEIDHRKKRKDYKIFKSLGEKYIDFLKNCFFIVGNSSSGIIEAPYFNKLFINIGNRQDGRLFSKSSTVKIYDFKKIGKVIENLIEKQNKFTSNNLYYKKNSIKNSINFIKQIDLRNINYKEFVDLKKS